MGLANRKMVGYNNIVLNLWFDPFNKFRVVLNKLKDDGVQSSTEAHSKSHHVFDSEG